MRKRIVCSWVTAIAAAALCAGCSGFGGDKIDQENIGPIGYGADIDYSEPTTVATTTEETHPTQPIEVIEASGDPTAEDAYHLPGTDFYFTKPDSYYEVDLVADTDPAMLVGLNQDVLNSTVYTVFYESELYPSYGMMIIYANDRGIDAYHSTRDVQVMAAEQFNFEQAGLDYERYEVEFVLGDRTYTVQCIESVASGGRPAISCFVAYIGDDDAVYQIMGITPEPNGIRSLLSSFSIDTTNEH